MSEMRLGLVEAKAGDAGDVSKSQMPETGLAAATGEAAEGWRAIAKFPDYEVSNLGRGLSSYLMSLSFIAKPVTIGSSCLSSKVKGGFALAGQIGRGNHSAIDPISFPVS